MKIHNINNRDFDLELCEIESIEFVGDFELVDIAVEDTRMFFANGIYTHNSGLGKEVVENDSISNSFAKLFALDFMMSISRRSKDKVNNVARLHISKNRLGPDGMTFPMRFDTSIGKFEVYDENTDSGKKVKIETITDEEYGKQLLAKQQTTQFLNSHRNEDLF